MATVTANATLKEWLAALDDITEIRDVEGNLLGVFTPISLAKEQALYEKAKRLFDPQEMERILREEKGKGIPLEEFWKRLETMEKK